MAKMIDIEDVIDTACLGSGDLLRQKRMMYLRTAPKVWDDLNLSSLKIKNRENLRLNKRTNTINLPCNSIHLSSVSYIDCNGIPHPCFVNKNIRKDIIDIHSNYNCSCGNELCNMIKGYQATTEYIDAEMPNGSIQTFKCIIRKKIDSKGRYFEQKQYPIRKLENGVWIDTILKTEEKELCRLEVNDKGCVQECEDNYEKVVGCGCYGNLYKKCLAGEVGETWISSCGSAMEIYSVEAGCCHGRSVLNFNNTYNISENGNRLEFPFNFGYDKVEVVYYTDIPLTEMEIPSIAEQTFITGLKTWEVMFDDSKQPLYANYSRRYESQKLWLLGELNKMTIAEWGQILSPKKPTPSFIQDGRF